MDGRGLQRAAVLDVLSRRSWWVPRTASNLLPPSAREDTRSLLAMEADQTMVQREGLLLFYCSHVQGCLTWTLNIPDPGN